MQIQQFDPFAVPKKSVAFTEEDKLDHEENLQRYRDAKTRSADKKLLLVYALFLVFTAAVAIVYNLAPQ